MNTGNCENMNQTCTFHHLADWFLQILFFSKQNAFHNAQHWTLIKLFCLADNLSAYRFPFLYPLNWLCSTKGIKENSPASIIILYLSFKRHTKPDNIPFICNRFQKTVQPCFDSLWNSTSFPCPDQIFASIVCNIPFQHLGTDFHLLPIKWLNVWKELFQRSKVTQNANTSTQKAQ